jgi:nickel-dependent lactate racemase
MPILISGINMSVISLPYGKTQLSLEIDDKLTPDIIMPPVSTPASDARESVNSSITHPIGGFSWDRVITNGQVAIAINDKTRPVPNSIMIPPLLEKLFSLGFKPAQITFYIATGTHIPMRSEEFSLLLPPEIISHYKVVSHDCDDSDNLEFLGTTSKNTPVWINSAFFNSDLKILVGNIEPHHFMGYSGGAKTASIGLTGRQTINHNHAMLVEPESNFGVYGNNPTRQDVEEIGDLIHIDAALNVVMNSAKQIVHSLFGTPREVMSAGIPLSQDICQIKIKHAEYDLVIASPGGYPKDINLYQSQKALSHAASITRDGGCVILVAQCIEGVGSNSYEAFMEGISSTEEVFTKIKEEGFKVGPHKALQFAREQKRIRIIIVSDIDISRLRRLLLEPAENLETAFTKASIDLPPHPRIAVMPKATNTIPQI